MFRQPTDDLVPQNPIPLPEIAGRRGGVSRVFTPARPSVESEGLLFYGRLFLRRKREILLITLLGIGIGLLFSYIQTPIYEARTSLEVQNFNDQFLEMGKVDPMRVNYDADSYIQTQVKMLQSESLLDRVAAKVPFGGVMNAPGERGSVLAQLRWPISKPLSPREKAIQLAVRNLKVRGSGMTRLIEIYADSESPQFAADFANTLASEFIQQGLDVRWKSAQRVTEWLTEQIENLRVKLERSEGRLNAYTRASGLLFLSQNKDSATDPRLAEVEQELFRAQADRVVKESKYELANTKAADSLPEVLDDITLREYQTRLADLQRQYAELSASYTLAHPQVLRLQAQINQLKTTVERQRNNIVSRIRNEYEAARRRETMLEHSYDQQVRAAGEQGSKAIQYNILKREADTTRQLYEGMLQKLKEAGVSAAMPVSNFRIVDTAKTPELPYRPDRALNLALGLCGGLFAAAGFVFIRERTARGLREPGELKVHLQVPELGLIPTSDSANVGIVKRIFSGKSTSLGANLATESPELAIWRQRSSPTAESYRSALTSILLAAEGEGGNRPQVIVFTSAGPREGKTTTVSNIGVAVAEIMSQTNQRVLLIDGDMRKPRLHDVFGVRNTEGLSDILGDIRPLKTFPVDLFVQRTTIPGLHLLPSGVVQERTSNLLYSPRFGALLRRLRGTYQAILIDTPPLIAFSDARVLARSADAVILVIRSGRTSLDAALVARQQFQDDGTPVLGTILTDWNPNGSTTASRYNYHEQYYRAYMNYYRSSDSQ